MSYSLLWMMSCRSRVWMIETSKGTIIISLKIQTLLSSRFFGQRTKNCSCVLSAPGSRCVRCYTGFVKFPMMPNLIQISYKFTISLWNSRLHEPRILTPSRVPQPATLALSFHAYLCVTTCKDRWAVGGLRSRGSGSFCAIRYCSNCLSPLLWNWSLAGLNLCLGWGTL